MVQPGEDASGVHVWLVMMRAYAALWEHAHRSIQDLDLCDSDFFVLEVLLHRGALPVNTIGQKVRLTSGSISIAVDRLEKRGLVGRSNATGDRRVRMVQLTECGRKLIGAAFAKHAEAMEAAAAGIADCERVQLIGLLKKIGKSAEAAR